MCFESVLAMFMHTFLHFFVLSLIKSVPSFEIGYVQS